MSKKTFFIFLVAFLALSAAGYSQQDDVVITVHADKRTGPMPYLYRNGNAINVKPLKYPLDKFFSDQKPGSFYVQGWGMDHYKKHRSSIAGLKSHAKDQTTGWDNNIGWMKNASDAGGEIILVLATSYWLGDEGDGLPPKNMDEWENFVRDTVDLFSNQMKLNISYQVWDEPDTEMFRGNLEQYFEVIRRTVIGIKKADPQAKFGGPGSSIFEGRGFRAHASEKPLIYNFIKYCSQTPLPEVGLSRIPIDSIGWHVFDAEPYTNVFKEQASQVRAWLREFGYDENTELNISSWTRWTGLTEDEFNGSFMASYILPMIGAMEKAGIQRQVYFNVFDHWLPEAGKYPGQEFFPGGYGLFSRHFVTKALYNSFAALSRVTGDRLKIEASDPFITTIAASEGDQVAILMSNYSPKDILPCLLDQSPALRPLKQLISRVKELQKRTGRSAKECAEEVISDIDDPLLRKRARLVLDLRERFAGKAKGEIIGELKGMRDQIKDERIKRDLDDVMKLYRRIRERKESPVPVMLSIKGLSQERMQYEHYIIDADHANAYAVRDRIDSIARRLGKNANKQEALRIIEEINNWPEVRLEASDRGSVKGGGELKRSFMANPYSVHLVILSPEK